MQRYHSIINYIPHAVHVIPLTHLLCHRKFAPPHLPHLSPLFPTGNYLLVFRISESVSLFADVLKTKLCAGGGPLLSAQISMNSQYPLSL